MKQNNNITPKNSVPSLQRNGIKPLFEGVVLFTTMEKPRMIEDLGMMYATKNSKKKRHYAVYQCGYCGNDFKCSVADIKNGHTRSCACYKKIVRANFSGVYISKDRIQNIWKNIIQRCYNKNTGCYYRYGGKGIGVCDEWRSDFTHFRDWALNNGYGEGLEIDRRDSNGDYEPSNCRWVTRFVSQQNKGMMSNNTSGYKGVMKNWNKWRTQINSNGVRYYLGSFSTKEQAAQAYNDFVIKNGTHHTLNVIPT